MKVKTIYERVEFGSKLGSMSSAGLTFLGLLVAAFPVSAGYISPGTTGGALCTDTAAFTTYDDCIGQVTDPKNEADGNPKTLLDYLNGGSGKILGFDSTTPWGVQGDWLGISGQLNTPSEDDPGNFPGTSTDGLFTVTTDGDLKSGGWTFDLGSLYIDYLVVTVKDGGGWSGYFYDLTTAEGVSAFSSTWDTQGITNGNGTAGPNVSHMFAAYIPGAENPNPDPDPDPDPNPVPLPGTLLLFGLGLGLLSRSRLRG